MDIKLPGHGAVERPDHLKVKDRVAGAVPPFDWSKIQEDSVGVVPGLFHIADRDQGGSSSCTCQATGYGFAYTTGIEVSRQDMYSNVALPGGGAYLNAPLDFLRGNGYVLLSKFPDPHPETEGNMTQKLLVLVGDRIRTFELKYTFYPDLTIDSAAHAISEHQYIHLGIRGSWVNGFSPSWIDPRYTQNDWQHALFAGKESIVLRNGVPAIKTKSSWCEHTDPAGHQVYCHYINKSYFDAGGVFEIIGVDIRETNDMGQLVTADGKTVWYISNGFRFWVLDPATLNQGSGKLWSVPPVQMTEPQLMAIPYGGAMFLSATDSPKS